MASSIRDSPINNFEGSETSETPNVNSLSWRKRSQSATTPKALKVSGSPNDSTLLSPSVQKLSTVSGRLYGFHNTVETEISQRRVEEEQRLQLIRDAVTHLDKVLQVETKRRQESFKTLQLMFEHQLSSIQSRLTEEIRETSEELSTRIEQIGHKIEDVERQVHEEREVRQAESEDSVEAAVKQVAAVQQALEAEKVARLEREAAILKRVSDDNYRLQEKIESERVGREGIVSTIRDEIESLDRQRQRFAERQQSTLLEEIAEMKERLDMEISGRESSEAQICQTIDEVVAGLQSGIHLMSK
ncbi:SF-assemblin [Carpediemonas membranifera]|uniref:SF-assemblin n=1 Tax=Carpediemonas membranifera TaxID=201153 RepID=A0A8J6BWH6_9EUKA|nr:SF-assemblin [Carpediemonas membranifera]|eukprot:KAG9392451.1 SF-assemblin [Carpediemonas membranifera]